jgi:hypothetical protein
MNQETKIDLLGKILPMLPAEVDRWQAEVDFRAVQIKIHGDEVMIYPEKAPLQFMAGKYAGYLKRIFPGKQIKLISSKGAKAKV